ncbi:hypothetical protein ACRAQ6_00970 [Erythrobacter sp. HA6-11]
MTQYSLVFAADTKSGVEKLTFHERSVGGALEVAKERARGDWAELFEGDLLLCRIELVDETGVWLVRPTSKNSQE